jgi:UDP:flavonoid glycosyltransferase YjiC (YdhE family)
MTREERTCVARSKVLFVSGSFGLGHVTRDLAVARELRRKAPQLDVQWLSAPPATEVLAQAGETLTPECQDYRSETNTADSVGNRGRLNLTKYVYLALGQWIYNARVIGRAGHRGKFDLIVGDETYEVVIAYVLGLRVMPDVPYVMLYDFWGVDTGTGSPFERLGAWGLNLFWTQQHRVTARGDNAALFIGEPADLSDRKFGIFFPNRRRYAENRLIYLGYMLTFNPALLPPKEKLRAELGYGPGPLVICTIGGTVVGRELLERCGQAYPLVMSRLPGLRLVLVCGPRLDPDRLEVPSGVEKRGFVPDLYRHLAASDLVITQGGGTTTLELTALRVPFLFFPVKGQMEQEITIASRLARQNAGVRMSLAGTTPQSLAAAITNCIGRQVSYPPIPCDGAARAADIILERLSRRVSAA